MEARRYGIVLVFAAVSLQLPSELLAASDRTANFVVSAPSRELAREVAQMAEQYRQELAIEWIGQELPRWHEPCPISVDVGAHLGAGGATSFMFEQGRPFGWRMSIQGSRERILDSVLPHEVTHTIFATYFGRPLPRWADEGACTSVEHASETSKQEQMLNQFLRSKPSRGIPFNRMFAMKEYPADIMPLYSQGFSLVRFLLNQGGKQKFVQYLGDGMRHEDWDRVTQQHYGFRDLSELQLTWVDWVAEGSPNRPDRSQIAANTPNVSGVDLLAANSRREFDTMSAASAREQEIGAPFDRMARNSMVRRDEFRQQDLVPKDLVPIRSDREHDRPQMALADQRQPEFISRGQDASANDSWYARQRDKMRGKSIFPLGGSTSGSRIAFSSFASLSGLANKMSQLPRQTIDTIRPVFDLNDPVPPPPALQQEADELLARPLAAQKPLNEVPFFFRHEKPLSAGGTVWR